MTRCAQLFLPDTISLVPRAFSLACGRGAFSLPAPKPGKRPWGRGCGTINGSSLSFGSQFNCSGEFSPGALVYLPPQKLTSVNCKSTKAENPHENQLGLKWLSSSLNMYAFLFLFCFILLQSEFHLFVCAFCSKFAIITDVFDLLVTIRLLKT